MNIEKLEQVEAWLLAGAPERKFNMNHLIHDYEDKTNWCGTSCCIAGYVYQMVTPREKWVGELCVVDKVAAKVLGLDDEVAASLFYVRASDGETCPMEWEDITPVQAAQAVRNVIVRGEPLWETILDFEDA